MTKYNIFKYKPSFIIILIISFFSILIFQSLIPPITDFIPHLAQIKAFWWAAKHPDGLFSINWFAPNTFYYYLLSLLVVFLPLVTAGKILWILIISNQLLAIAFLHKRHKTPFPFFVISILLVFNLNLYWGFGNFLIAWGLLLWYLGLDEDSATSLRIILALLIAWSHIFLVLPLFVWDAMRWWGLPQDKRRLTWWTSHIAIAAWILSWMVLNFGPKSSGALQYNFSIFERISLNWLTLSMQGGLQGVAEIVVVVVVILILATSHFSSIENPPGQGLWKLTLLACLLLLLGLFLPDKGLNTVRASQRWIPLGVQLILLTCKETHKNWLRIGIRGATAITAVYFLTATGLAWHHFKHVELRGLTESTNSVPTGSRLLMLDFNGFGSEFQTRATMHSGAYAQLIRGATPQTTFADNPAAFIRFTKKRSYTPLLEWYPERIQKSDILNSDVAIVSGPEETHVNLVNTGFFQPLQLTGEGELWRAYKIIAPPDPKLWEKNP